MSKPKLMLVDDDQEFVTTLAKKFNKLGFEDTKIVFSGAEALALLKKESVDIAILDVRMPEMDGLTLLDKIRSDWPAVEVIMLTGYATVQNGVEGMKKGAYDFLVKPANMDVLEARINAAYAKKQAHEDLEREKETSNS